MKRRKTWSTVVSVLATVVFAVGCGDSGGSKEDAARPEAGVIQGGQTGSTSAFGDAAAAGTTGAAGSISTSIATSGVAGNTAGGSQKGGTGGAGGTGKTGGAGGTGKTGGAGGTGKTGGSGGAVQTGGTGGKGGANGGSRAGDAGIDAGVSDAAPDSSTEAQRDAASLDLLSVSDLKGGCDAPTCTLNCPYGYVMDVNGCATCACAPNPELACNQLMAAGICDASPKCRWLTPGCAYTGTALPAAGCYDKSAIDCTTATGCSDGKSCVPRVISPCVDGACASCGATINICL